MGLLFYLVTLKWSIQVRWSCINFARKRPRVRLVIPLISRCFRQREVFKSARLHLSIFICWWWWWCAIDLFTVSNVTFVASMHASLHLCLTLLAVHAVISVSSCGVWPTYPLRRSRLVFSLAPRALLFCIRCWRLAKCVCAFAVLVLPSHLSIGAADEIKRAPSR